jgi:uncharacterized protein (TIGR02246 family)
MQRLLILVMAGLSIGHSSPYGYEPSSARAEIERVLETQADLWNRGDVDSFVSYYAEDCTYVGKQVLMGRDKLLERYKKTFSSPAAMGKLTFSNLVIHPLDASVATVTGNWHLERTTDGGGPVGGVFSLVFQQHGNTWQIALDHTS